MSAAYDNYDYPAYWLGREYEHKSEGLALKKLLSKVHKIHTIMEIGVGFGRLTPSYSFRAKKVILSDPSSRLLKIARESFTSQKYKFVHSTLENLPLRIKKSSLDTIVIVRVLHHIQNLDKAFFVFNRLLKKGGYLLLEFPNKRNLKAVIRHFIKGDHSFLMDTERRDLRSRQNIKKHSLPFYNYHPENIKSLLAKHNFEIRDVYSVSNARSTFLKRVLPIDLLLYIEKVLQKPLGYIYFGPSIFILAQKRG
jgi:ubiquinone/menaquinone biosynthesis C-methylase UbiE